ncbi:hypothetical protein [Candidatus Binatus sp.]|uniref:hypothetical protein n=1 Tax=Candidatus Binatus sp. TaxID=2811406 RepID=UPI003C854247
MLVTRSDLQPVIQVRAQFDKFWFLFRRIRFIASVFIDRPRYAAAGSTFIRLSSKILMFLAIYR